MTPTEHPRLAARRRRILRIRRTVAGAAVAVFLATFTTIYVQMAEGHDPALAATSAKTAKTAVVTSATSDDTYEQSAPAPVTTRQS